MFHSAAELQIECEQDQQRQMLFKHVCKQALMHVPADRWKHANACNSKADVMGPVFTHSPLCLETLRLLLSQLTDRVWGSEYGSAQTVFTFTTLDRESQLFLT